MTLKLHITHIMAFTFRESSRWH